MKDFGVGWNVLTTSFKMHLKADFNRMIEK